MNSGQVHFHALWLVGNSQQALQNFGNCSVRSGSIFHDHEMATHRLQGPFRQILSGSMSSFATTGDHCEILWIIIWYYLWITSSYPKSPPSLPPISHRRARWMVRFWIRGSPVALGSGSSDELESGSWRHEPPTKWPRRQGRNWVGAPVPVSNFDIFDIFD